MRLLIFASGITAVVDYSDLVLFTAQYFIQ